MDSGKVTVAAQSVKTDCSGAIAYDTGTYTESISGGGVKISNGVQMSGGVQIGGEKRVQGNYLVVLERESGKWFIAQHASTEQPVAQQH